MEEQKFRKKERRKLLLVASFCFIAIISIVGYTYSYFVASDTDSTTITGTVASASLSINVEKKAPGTNEGLIPQLDSAITSAVVGRNNLNCVDDNGNEVCQVYEITVTNTSNVALKVDGKLELSVGGNTNLKWALIDSYSDGMTTKPNLVSGINSHRVTKITSKETFQANQTKPYYLVIWISETDGVQNDTGTFTGVVTFMDSASNPPAALATLTNLNLTSSIKTDTPSFAKVSYSTCDTSVDTACENTVGIYSMEDDLGTSYYFRGDVENNYVYFAGFYWRIIRINGDGTVRMIYDGTSAHENGESSEDRQITTMAFNSSLYNDNTYVGYMYGTVGVTATGEEGYNQTHSNTTDSTIKAYLEDEWYAQNIKDTTYEQYVADAIYCNDRSLDTSNASYTGIGQTDTFYAPYQRLKRLTTPEPTLKCKNQNDRFTYNESIEGVAGNDKLEAPIGLITADEVALAGAYGSTTNNSYYLYSGNNYWTMSPSYFYDGSAAEFYVNPSGGLYNYIVDINGGVRAVLTLSSDALKYSETSNGSKEYPFTV